mmetsp:Transcript_49830/g.160151  ORF Transcript_49830/g.160151 Transcript_49830/m.160151 type:complete len:237 (-) Transcript_49830:307-1017(-)
MCQSPAKAQGQNPRLVCYNKTTSETRPATYHTMTRANRPVGRCAKTNKNTPSGLTLASGQRRVRCSRAHSEREVLQSVRQAQVVAVHEHQGLALVHIRATRALLAELRQVRLQALNFREGDIQRLAGRQLGQALLVPCSLKGHGFGFGGEVDEAVAQVRLPTCSTRQVQEIEGPGVLPLVDQHLLSAHHRQVAHHQCRLVLRCVHVGRKARIAQHEGVFRGTPVGGAQLVITLLER